MALDEALARRCETGGTATLRFYGWERPTLSMGRHQRVAEAADLEACGRMGIDLVRRPTGGLAVLHEQEVTYSLSLPSSDPVLARGLRCAVAEVAEALACGLRRAGIPARRLPGSAGADRSLQADPACFLSASAREEIAAEGLKVAGSAQWRLRRAFLQHGSIPLRISEGRLRAATGSPHDGARQRAGHAAPGGLGSWLGGRGEASCAGRSLVRDADGVTSALVRSLLEGFGIVLGVGFEVAQLEGDEIALARKLEREVYATRAWTWRL